jgi:hypothetical protein
MDQEAPVCVLALDVPRPPMPPWTRRQCSKEAKVSIHYGAPQSGLLGSGAAMSSGSGQLTSRPRRMASEGVRKRWQCRWGMGRRGTPQGGTDCATTFACAVASKAAYSFLSLSLAIVIISSGVVSSPPATATPCLSVISSCSSVAVSHRSVKEGRKDGTKVAVCPLSRCRCLLTAPAVMAWALVEEQGTAAAVPMAAHARGSMCAARHTYLGSCKACGGTRG